MVRLVMSLSIISLTTGVLWWRSFLSSRSPARRLVEVKQTTGRTIEARLSGGFAWTPFREYRGSRDSSVGAI